MKKQALTWIFFKKIGEVYAFLAPTPTFHYNGDDGGELCHRI